MKLFFAGAEAKDVRDMLEEAGVKNILVSYYYVKDRNVDVAELFQRFDNVVIDSGAFTLGAGHGQKKKQMASEIDYDGWIDEYLKLLYDWSGRFFWAANLDLDILLGKGRVKKYNELFEELEAKVHQRVCYVVHDSIMYKYSHPYQNLYEYFDRYGMIGVSGDWKGSKSDVAYFQQVYNLSKKYKKFVHGFAMTNFVSFDRFPFYTCDSTTYLGGAKYGTTYVWNGAYFETWDYTKKYRRKSLKRQCEEWGIHFTKFCNDDIREVTRFNIRSWLKNEEAFNRKTKHIQWWS